LRGNAAAEPCQALHERLTNYPPPYRYLPTHGRFDTRRLANRGFFVAAGAPSGARHHSETAGFMEVATKQVYGTASGGGSMAERVGRRKFFNDRTGTDNAFRR